MYRCTAFWLFRVVFSSGGWYLFYSWDMFELLFFVKLPKTFWCMHTKLINCHSVILDVIIVFWIVCASFLSNFFILIFCIDSFEIAHIYWPFLHLPTLFASFVEEISAANSPNGSVHHIETVLISLPKIWCFGLKGWYAFRNFFVLMTIHCFYSTALFMIFLFSISIPNFSIPKNVEILICIGKLRLKPIAVLWRKYLLL